MTVLIYETYLYKSESESESVDLPVLDQHLLPDDLPDDLPADATQLGERGVEIVEAVQQNLGHLSLLLSYQPGKDVFKKYVNFAGYSTLREWSIGIF